MKPGDLVLARFPGVGGAPTKLRPALVLVELPGPVQRYLLCGISKKTANPLPDWDELLDPSDSDFVGSGLHQASIIRLSFLRAVVATEVLGSIGSIDPGRLDRLRTRLADHVRP